MSRFITPRLFSKSSIAGAAEIDVISATAIRCMGFKAEKPHTSFIECPVAILQANSMSEFLLDDINQILGGCLTDKYKKLNTLFSSSGLYAPFVLDRNETDTFIFYDAIALVLSAQPQILK